MKLEIDERERAIIVLAMGALVLMIQNGMVAKTAAGIPLPTFDELRELRDRVWPENDPAVFTRNDPAVRFVKGDDE